MKRTARRFSKGICFLLTIAVIAGMVSGFTQVMRPLAQSPQDSMQMRGKWVTSAFNLDWPSRQGLSNDAVRNEIDAILARAVEQNLNAVFVQVRPSADALYNSEIFPWSHLLSGTQGQAPQGGFDPLAYWIEQAGPLGIEVHAWINPFRVTLRPQNITNPNQLYINHPARQNPDLVIAHDSMLFFDPGNPDARQLILDGIEELLRNYELDGIHLDDYFYPGRNFPDQASFARFRDFRTPCSNPCNETSHNH